MNTQEKLTAIRDKCVLDVEHYVKLGPLIYSRQESALAACRATIAVIDWLGEVQFTDPNLKELILTAWEGIV